MINSMQFKDSITVKKIFDGIASKYDFLNDLLSFGLHRTWKKKLLSKLDPLPGEKWLDLCCGTGDMSFLLAKYVGPTGTIFGLDSANQPLSIAKKRAFENGFLSIRWLNDDALITNLPDHEFDGIVMAYGLRNLVDIKKGFEEVYRLLKPGRRVGFLDFKSFNDQSIFARFQIFYLRNIVVPIASFFGLGKQYSYIESSLKVFPLANKQKEIALSVGFKNAQFQTLAFGQMGILILYT